MIECRKPPLLNTYTYENIFYEEDGIMKEQNTKHCHGGVELEALLHEVADVSERLAETKQDGRFLLSSLAAETMAKTLQVEKQMKKQMGVSALTTREMENCMVSLHTKDLIADMTDQPALMRAVSQVANMDGIKGMDDISFLRLAAAAAKQAAGVDTEHALFLYMVGFSFQVMADTLKMERSQDQISCAE